MLSEFVLHVQLPQFHEYLQHMEPLPQLPGLSAAQAMLDKLHQGIGLAAQLTHFVGRAAALPAVLRSRALASLEAGMRQRRHELLLPPTECALSHGFNCLIFRLVVFQSHA